MAIFGNFKGTTKSDFQIGKTGTKISTTQPSEDITTGDLFIDGANATLQVYDGAWKSIGSTLTDLNVDSGTLVVDSSNDTVSIGSTSSNEKLFVNGSLRLGTNPSLQHSGAYLDLRHSNGSTSQVRIRDNGSNTDPIFKVYNANNTAEVFKVQGDTTTFSGEATLTGIDTLRINENGTGLRMTNVGAFDNSGGDFRVFSTGNLILSTNGDSGTAVTFDQNTKDATFTGAITTSDAITATGNVTAGNLVTSGSVTVDRLALSSTQTTVPPLQLTASSLNDGVGALRIDSVEPDIFLNDTDGGFSTVTFGAPSDGGIGRVAFGRNSGNDFYLTVRDPSTNSGNWRNDTFVADSSTGNISMGYSLTISNSLTINDYTLPTADGTADQVLSTDGNGTLSFATVSANPGGSNTQIQYNSDGSFAGTDAFTFDEATSTLETGVVRGVIFEPITDYGTVDETANMAIDFGIVIESATAGDFEYLDDTYGPTADSFTVAGLPSAAQPGQMIYVSDESGGPVMAFSDGTNWRRITDRAVVS